MAKKFSNLLLTPDSYALTERLSQQTLINALIGQTSIAFGLSLHTFNVKHYAVIPGLITVQPYKRL